MFDDFFIRALVAGIGVAFVTGPLGCFVIWRRLSYFGDTLAHSALLGVTLAFTMEFNIALSVFIISSLIALTLIQLQKRTNLPGDALLGLLAHSSLAVGLVVIGFLTFIRFDIMGLLFGDILAVTVDDLLIIWIGGALILLILKQPNLSTAALIGILIWMSSCKFCALNLIWLLNLNCPLLFTVEMLQMK